MTSLPLVSRLLTIPRELALGRFYLGQGITISATTITTAIATAITVTVGTEARHTAVDITIAGITTIRGRMGEGAGLTSNVAET